MENPQLFAHDVSTVEYGVVVGVADGIIKIVGLNDLKAGEMVFIGESKILGMILNLEKKLSRAVLFGTDRSVSAGDIVTQVNSLTQIGTSTSLLGRVIDSLGNQIDGGEELIFEEFRAIDIKAPGIISRKSVHESMPTGIKIIDSMLPIGNGQRELIIGDRQTGKTSVAIDSITNQKNNELQMICIYVAIGQKKSSISFLVNKLKNNNSLEYTVFVLAGASDPAALQFLSPYSGCAIGEWFRDNGMNALIIYDDLSKHAVAYRQMSLLLRRPPSREAFPGDIFYLHSRLLERASKLNETYGNGSLTALPIIETLAGDLSAYIPTNVISITDGQIFLEEELFKSGMRPAINLNLSVSRVGSAAQKSLMKSISGALKLFLASYQEVSTFSSFSSDLDITTINLLNRGSKINELLKQKNYNPFTIEEQFIILFAGLNGFFDNVDISDISILENFILIKFNEFDFYNEISSTTDLHHQLIESLEDIVSE